MTCCLSAWLLNNFEGQIGGKGHPSSARSLPVPKCQVFPSSQLEDMQAVPDLANLKP